MKINDQLPFINKQKNQSTPLPEQHFEQLINTPTQKNSGDEYYWQHQNQLQQSCLHFEPHVSTKERLQPLIRSNQSLEQTERTKVLINSDELMDEKPALNPVYTKNYNTNKITNQLAPSDLEMESEVTQLSEINPISHTATFIENRVKTKTIQSSNAQEHYTQHLKNHHLFVNDNEVELTLNTYELKVQEQKELKQMIKYHLKKQGFSLQKLIINGVTND